MRSDTPYRRKDGEQSYPVSAPDTLLPFLLGTLKGKSRNNVKSLLSRKLVAVDGVPTSRYDEPLVPGQSVSILSTPAPKNGWLPFPVLFEDDRLIVVNKPAKLLTVANEKEKVRTAYHMVTDYVRSRRVDARVYVLHRLDRDTSGVLMFAKDQATKELYQSRWGGIILRRGYRALVEGAPRQDRDTVRSFLVETKTHMVFSGAPGPGAKEAVTNYEVLRSGNGYSLLDISIDTGRKNQIRVHMGDIGCPIAGDKQYGAHTNPIGRLCLHANELTVHRPDTGETVCFTARTPRDFKRVFKG